MLTIKLKGPANIGNLQGPFEASIMNRHSWVAVADRLDIVVKHFGPSTMPDDIVRSQVEEFRESLEDKYAPSTINGIISAGSSFYTWMNHMEFAATNPFRGYRIGYKPYRDVQVIA